MTQIDQDKVEISCAPKNKTHIPSIHSAIGNLKKDSVLFESGKSIKLTSLDYETRTIRQTDIMLNNFIFAKQQENYLSYEAERHGPAPPSKIDQNIELIN